jgi:hypothetical protein
MSENALRTRVFGGILVEACRPESGDVGVGWGQDWGQRSSSNWQLPVPSDVRGDGAIGSRYGDRAVRNKANNLQKFSPRIKDRTVPRQRPLLCRPRARRQQKGVSAQGTVLQHLLPGVRSRVSDSVAPSDGLPIVLTRYLYPQCSTGGGHDLRHTSTPLRRPRQAKLGPGAFRCHPEP